MLLHQGDGVDDGHYVASIRDEDGWIMVDDGDTKRKSALTTSDWANVRAALYARTDQSQRCPSTTPSGGDLYPLGHTWITSWASTLRQAPQAACILAPPGEDRDDSAAILILKVR